jgi:hypothetical protein
MEKSMFDFKKVSIILLLGAFFAFDVSAKEEGEKKKIEAEPDKTRKCEKTDSLNAKQEKLLTKDDKAEVKKHHPSSSMSSMSYNILFQVIYRYSFDEIFDSPAASEIVTN